MGQRSSRRALADQPLHLYLSTFWFVCFFFFFFKQKTAYEIQGDWSSDVCSSDLLFRLPFILWILSRCIGAFRCGRSTTHSQRPADRVTYLESDGEHPCRQKQKLHYAPPIRTCSWQRHLYWRRLGPRSPHRRSCPSASLTGIVSEGNAFPRTAAMPTSIESSPWAWPNSSSRRHLRIP